MSVSAASARAGASITVTATPANGYEIRAVTVLTTGGNSVTVSGSGGNYRFTMPASAVTVNAEFTVKTLGKFEDIKGTDWFFEDAVWAYSYKDGILRGYSETEWQPLTPIHSVSVAVTLRRMDGADLTPYYTGEEDGLDNSAWYVAAARWATVNGILPAPFGGYAPLTRGEYAVILRNYLRYRGIDVTPSQPAGFSDSDQMTADEREAFQFLNEAGIYRGDASGAMLPKNNLHRAHLAALLHRLSDYIIKVETANN